MIKEIIKIIILTAICLIVAMITIKTETLNKDELIYASKYEFNGYHVGQTAKVIGKITNITDNCITLEDKIDCYIKHSETSKAWTLSTQTAIVVKGIITDKEDRVIMQECEIK